jgi:RNA polymerase sigma-70 factor (ECF subfamily)
MTLLALKALPLVLLRTTRYAGADDATLALAAAEGNPHAATAVWDRFSPLVRGMLRRSIGPDHEVEDQVQEVFLRFFRQLHTLRDPAAVRSFLIGITIRVAGSEIRRRRVRRWLRLTPTGSLVDFEGVTLDRDAREAVSRLYAILDQLQPQGRLTFVLRHIEGLELTQIAEALSISLATAKRRLSRVSSRVYAMVERDPLLAAYLAKPGSGPHPDSESDETASA